MKIIFLGTAASEGFPAVFCNCEHCREARRLGGKNIRTRSQALINDDLLIDFPADTYSHFLNNNIEADIIKYLLVTHSHSDHFYEKDLGTRFGVYAHDMRVDKIKMYCSEGAAKKMNEMDDVESFMLTYEALNPFSEIEMGDYKVISLPARHFEGDGALFYIIKEKKTVLYAHDTGYFYDEVFDYIKNTGYQFDLISLDCTNVDIPINDEGSHMGVDNINRVVQKLKEMDAVTDKTKIVINHFSHNACPIHHKLEERVAQYGYIVSYDGLSIEV